MSESRLSRLVWLYVLRTLVGNALHFSARGGAAGSFEARINRSIAAVCRMVEAEIEVEEAK